MLTITSIWEYGKKIQIKGDIDIRPITRIMERDTDNKHTLFIRNTNIDGFYDFGLQAHEADYWGNPAGYVWSSRAGVVNKVFGVKLVDVYYNSMCIAISVDKLTELLDLDRYYIKEYIDKRGEITYSVKEIEQ